MKINWKAFWVATSCIALVPALIGLCFLWNGLPVLVIGAGFLWYAIYKDIDDHYSGEKK